MVFFRDGGQIVVSSWKWKLEARLDVESVWLKVCEFD